MRNAFNGFSVELSGYPVSGQAIVSFEADVVASSANEALAQVIAQASAIVGVNWTFATVSSPMGEETEHRL
jgi:hypothetical protein